MNLSKLKQSNPSKELVDEMRKLLKGRTGNTAYQTVSKRLAGKRASPLKAKKQRSQGRRSAQHEARVDG
jgi:hypothetical protein